MGSVSRHAGAPLAVARGRRACDVPGARAPAGGARPVSTRSTRGRRVRRELHRAADGPGALELALERAPYVDFFLADPDPALVARVHAAGAVCGWQVETADEARAAEAAGCDVVIAKAWESGGRKRVEGPTLLPLLDGVLDAVSIPVIAAGGIATARGVAAALRPAPPACASARASSRPPSPTPIPTGWPP